jgi:hypothetical protein
MVSVVVVGAGVAQTCCTQAQKIVTMAAEKNKRQESICFMDQLRTSLHENRVSNSDLIWK